MSLKIVITIFILNIDSLGSDFNSLLSLNSSKHLYCNYIRDFLSCIKDFLSYNKYKQDKKSIIITTFKSCNPKF